MAVLVGLAFLYVFDLQDEPSVLAAGTTLAHVFGAAASVAVTEALLTLVRLPHPPAGTTTLLVNLGLFTTPRQLVSLVAGIVILTAVCWVINRAFGAPVPVWGPRQ